MAGANGGRSGLRSDGRHRKSSSGAGQAFTVAIFGHSARLAVDFGYGRAASSFGLRRDYVATQRLIIDPGGAVFKCKLGSGGLFGSAPHSFWSFYVDAAVLRRKSAEIDVVHALRGVVATPGWGRPRQVIVVDEKRNGSL